MDSTQDMLNPTIAVFQDTIVLIAWEDDIDSSYGADILFARSTDGGASFGPSVVLNDTPGNGFNQTDASIAVDSLGRVYVVYTGSTAPFYVLGLVTSCDTGATFGRERGNSGHRRRPVCISYCLEGGAAIRRVALLGRL